MPTREDRLRLTREAAWAFVEDMKHIREVLSREIPDRGELRRLSGPLRRLLIDNGGDILRVASPRIGRVHLVAPDNAPITRSGQITPFAFFASGGVKAFGVDFRAAMFEAGQSAREIEGFDPDATINLKFQDFLGQPVMCINGDWVTRLQIVTYIANKASAVHSDSRREGIDKLISRMRRSADFRILNGMPTYSFNLDAYLIDEHEFKYSPGSIDPVLLELQAAAHFLASSPSIEDLEKTIISGD
jgi:hypothetical protein